MARLSYFHCKSIVRHLPAYTRAISTGKFCFIIYPIFYFKLFNFFKDPSSIVESVRSKLKNQDSHLERKQINLLSSVLCGRSQTTDDRKYNYDDVK